MTVQPYNPVYPSIDSQDNAQLVHVPRTVLSSMLTLIPIKDTVAFISTCRYARLHYADNDELWKPCLIFKITAWGIPSLPERIQSIPVSGFAKIYPVAHKYGHKLSKANNEMEIAKRDYAQSNPGHLGMGTENTRWTYKEKVYDYRQVLQYAQSSVFNQCATNLVECELPKALNERIKAESEFNKSKEELHQAAEELRQSLANHYNGIPGVLVSGKSATEKGQQTRANLHQAEANLAKARTHFEVLKQQAIDLVNIIPSM